MTSSNTFTCTIHHTSVSRRSVTWHRRSQRSNWVTVLWNSVSPTTASTDHRTGTRTLSGRGTDRHVCRRSPPIVFIRGRRPVARNRAWRKRRSSHDFSHERRRGPRCRTLDCRVMRNFDEGPEIRRRHSFERLRDEIILVFALSLSLSLDMLHASNPLYGWLHLQKWMMLHCFKKGSSINARIVNKRWNSLGIFFCNESVSRGWCYVGFYYYELLNLAWLSSPDVMIRSIFSLKIVWRWVLQESWIHYGFRAIWWILIENPFCCILIARYERILFVSKRAKSSYTCVWHLR